MESAPTLGNSAKLFQLIRQTGPGQSSPIRYRMPHRPVTSSVWAVSNEPHKATEVQKANKRPQLKSAAS